MSDIGPDVELIVTGWGTVEGTPQTHKKFELLIIRILMFELFLGGNRSNALLKTNLTGVTLEWCNSSLLGYEANNRRLRNGVNLGQICAFDPQGRHDACQVCIIFCLFV